MEHLFNAEVIKAAAASQLGVLSLMSLILGAIALIFFQKAETPVRIIVFMLLFGGVTGFGYAMMNQNQNQNQNQKKTLKVDTDFVVGRWRVDQKVEDRQGGSFIDYNADGGFSGSQEEFTAEGHGFRKALSGIWNLRKLSDEEFEMILTFEDGLQHTMRFRVLDRDHVHNLNENYVSVRVPK
jgi:hypothetical protein